MGNEVTIRVVGKNDSKPATAEVKKEMAELGQETGKVKERIKELTTEISHLNHQLDATGDTSLFEMIAEKEQELAKFTRTAKKLADELKQQAEEAAQKAAQQGFHLGDVFTTGMLSSFEAATPALIGGLVALGVAATPTIGAMIGGAVIGGVGMGGMIGGILAATRDPRVKAAGSEFAANALGDLSRLGGPFVEPVVGALDRLDDKIRGVSMGPLARSFEDLSREFAPFELNLERAVDKFLPGFTHALKASEPVIRTIGDELPGLFADIGAMFDAMSEDPDGAVMGIKKLIDVVGDVLVLFGELVGWLEQTYEGGVAIGLVMSAMFEKWFHWMSILLPPFELLSKWMGTVNDDLESQADALDRANQPATQFGNNLDGVKTAAEEAAEQINDLNKAIDDLLGKTLSWDQLQIRWHDGLHELREELASGAKTLSMFTEEGRKNRSQMDEMIGVAIRLRDEEVQRTGDLQAANAHFQENIETLRKQGEAAGFAKTELDKLFAPFKNGPVQMAFEFQFAGLLEGLTQMERAIRLQQLLSGFASSASGWSSQRNDERRGMASGGISSGGWTPINEQGWEMVKLPSGATVIPHGASEAMVSGASGGSSQPILVQLTLPSGDVWREVLIDDALTRGVDSTTVAGAYP